MIVLASKSASRRAMLDAAGVAYQSIPAEIDERALEASLPGHGPDRVAKALAQAKAQAVSQDRADSLVLGSDSLVAVDGRTLDGTLQSYCRIAGNNRAGDLRTLDFSIDGDETIPVDIRFG